MFKERYKKDMERINPDVEFLSELSKNMKTALQPKQPRHHFFVKKAISAMTAAAVLVLCIFGGNMLFNKQNDFSNPPAVLYNSFSIVAYAADEGGTNEESKTVISKDMKVVLPFGSVKRDGKLTAYTDENGQEKQLWDNTVFHHGEFSVQGENIKSVTYSCEKGELHYLDVSKIEDGHEDKSENGEVSLREITQDPATFDFKGKMITANYNDVMGKNSFQVDWFFQEVLDIVSSNAPLNYEDLPSDVITVTVTFKDGQTMVQSVKISFQSDGKFIGELVN